MLIAKNKPMKGHSVCSMLTKNNVIVLMYVDKKAIVQNSESSTKKNPYAIKYNLGTSIEVINSRKVDEALEPFQKSGQVPSFQTCWILLFFLFCFVFFLERKK